MAISILDVFKTVASEKYKKTNVALYLIIAIAVSLALSFNIHTQSKPLALASIILGLVFYVFVFGYFALSANNEINKKETVFPSPGEMINILKYGVLYSLGTALISIILYLIPITVLYIGAMLIILGAIGAAEGLIFFGYIFFIVSLIIMALLGYYYLYPILIRFLVTFNFKDFFNFKQAIAFRRERKGIYISFFWKSFIINFMLGCIASVIAYILAILFHVSDKNIIQMIVSGISLTLSAVFIPNLIGQIVNTKNE